MNKVFKYNCGCQFPIIGYQETKFGKKPLLEFNPDIEKIPLECQRTWDLLCDGNVVGCFQLESSLGQLLVKKLQPRNIEHLSALIAIMRPGPSESLIDGKSITQRYIDRKNGKEEITYFHPALEPILKDTYGLSIFQESHLRIAQEIAGFTLAESDILRKCVAEGSIVLTQSGPSKGQCNYKILSTNESGQLKYYDIEKVWPTGKQIVYRITTDSGHHIELTDKHQVYTKQGWKKVVELTRKDYVTISNRYQYEGCLKPHQININKSIILSYFIFIGYYTKDVFLKIRSYDPWITEKILSISQKEFGSNSYTVSQPNSRRKDIHFQNKAFQWFSTIYTPCKVKERYIPSHILYAANDITTAFVGACFASKGNMNVKKKKISVTTTSYKIAQQLQILLLRDDIYSNLVIRNNRYDDKPYESYQTYYITISDPTNIRRFLEKYSQYIPPDKLDKVRQIESDLSDIATSSTDTQYQFTKIRRITKLGEKQTFDFTVKGEYNYGFINGILVHNSIGKKKPEEISKIKKPFIDGCVKKGIVNKKEAEQIFEWIQASQRYQFNKSHSVSYALNCYLSAYCKAHFPRAFFTSYLHYAQGKQDTLQEIKKLILNARSMDIQVNPPNIIHQNTKFKLIDQIIRFGLSDIKGIGQSMIEKLSKIIYHTEKTIQKNIISWNWMDFLVYTSSQINSTTLKALICSGALDHLNQPQPRTKMLYEYDQYNQLSNHEKKWCQIFYKNFNNGINLLQLLKELYNSPIGQKGGCVNTNRKEKVRSLIDMLQNPKRLLKDNPAWVSAQEEFYLGVPLTHSSVESCDISQANCTCDNFLKGLYKKPIFLPVVIDKVVEIKTKSGKNPGQPMAFMNVSDISGSVNAVIFPDVWIKVKSLVVENNHVMMIGGPGKNDSFIVNALYQI